MTTPDSTPKSHGRGRPGKYPGTPLTTRMRVPVGSEEYVLWALTELPSLYQDYCSAAKSTRDWTAFSRFAEAVSLSQYRHLNGRIQSGVLANACVQTPKKGRIVFFCDPAKDVYSDPS